jgi:hypothetical protein
MKPKRQKPLVFTDAARPAEPSTQGRTDTPPSETPVRGSTVSRPIEERRSRRSRSSHGPALHDLGFARHAYKVSVLAGVVWAAGLAAFVAGFQTQFGAFDYSPLQWVVVGLLAVLPAAFMLLSAFALRQGAQLAAETRKARALAAELAAPAMLAADQTGGVFEAMRREIEKASAAAQAAREPIAALREAMAQESQRLSEAAAEAQSTGRHLTETLGRERNALGEMRAALQVQAADAAEALARQARIVADASDLAQAQLDEAQAALTARAADLAVAAGDARHAAETAGDQLTRQIDKLETTGVALGGRVQDIALGLGREREVLSGLADNLRADQEDLAVRLETQRAQLTEAAAAARESATVLSSASTEGAEALRDLIAAAAEEVRNLAETAHREQAALDAQARAAIGLFSGAVAEERAEIEAQTKAAIDELAAAAEEARTAAAVHVQATAEAARESLDQIAENVAAKIDTLSEAAFAAGRRADQVFDDRISAARQMIEQSAVLVEETGERSAQRIEAGLAGARSALSEMETLLTEIDSRMERLPEEARTQAAAVRQAVEQGVGDLTAAARRAAEETQAIDAAFQERVRRNYEILSDAVRLMAKVAGAADMARAPAAAPAIKPAAPVIRATVVAAPPEPESAPEAEREPEQETERGPMAMPEYRAVAGDRSIRVSMSESAPAARLAPEPMRPAALSDPHAADPASRRAENVTAAAAGLRPRLRLTPASVDIGPVLERAPEPISSVPISIQLPKAAARTPAKPAEADTSAMPDEWTWKDLLSSMEEPAVDDEELADLLIGEIQALGVDAAALLPRSRIDEIAAALQTGDAGGAREVVRRLAPAAVRRLSRRVLTDKALRAQADRYVRRYEGLLTDSAQRDREGYMTAALLGSDPGRAFLLLDAAVGDLH